MTVTRLCSVKLLTMERKKSQTKKPPKDKQNKTKNTLNLEEILLG